MVSLATNGWKESGNVFIDVQHDKFKYSTCIEVSKTRHISQPVNMIEGCRNHISLMNFSIDNLSDEEPSKLKRSTEPNCGYNFFYI